MFYVLVSLYLALLHVLISISYVVSYEFCATLEHVVINAMLLSVMHAVSTFQTLVYIVQYNVGQGFITLGYAIGEGRGMRGEQGVLFLCTCAVCINQDKVTLYRTV